MGLHDALGHRQPEAEPARCTREVVAASVEPLMDMWQVLGVDPRAPIADLDLHSTRGCQPCADLDRGALWGVTSHVVEQALQHVGQRHAVRTDPEVLGNLDAHGVGGGERTEPMQHPIDQPEQRQGCGSDRHLATLQGRGVEQRGDQPLEPSRVGVDAGKQVLTPWLRELFPASHQSLAESTNDRERRSELM